MTRQSEATVIDARRDAELASGDANEAAERGDVEAAKDGARRAMRAAWRAWLNVTTDEDRHDAQIASEAAQDASEAALDVDPAWNEQAEDDQAEHDARMGR